MVFQLCSFSAFLIHGLLIMSFYYFCFALPKLRTSDYHNRIDCLMCYEWALKINNSTVPTFLKSIISIKSDFYVLSLYKNYYYQIMPTEPTFLKSIIRLKPEFYVLLNWKCWWHRGLDYMIPMLTVFFKVTCVQLLLPNTTWPQQLWPYYFYSTNGALLF